ncbi:metal-dependent hydrolase family protein [Pseudoruegeria sp. SHC-113]|uniref:metal-dependent hydrolase family protein n=1 Tax=Pseudoruegeria sp. SHC-113 TaxID=2855439 RepID=UPI0021BB8AF7|nr:amidohydrolase family protein [Pseudoruegeria sp. SHC-113]MCT8160105.1 amidohydrolase family protein [Pseudoruegeria sp. SHC-113]
MLIACTAASFAQDAANPPKTLITNVNVFDGNSETLTENASVLIEGNLIASVSSGTLEAEGASVIDGGGRTLMPGIIEGHSHLALSGVTFGEVVSGLASYQTIQSTVIAEQMLMNGVTTTRDMAGEVFSLKRAIDEGTIPGPRIYASGAMISQTSGHGDFRLPIDRNPGLGGPTPTTDLKGAGALVDGVPRMLAATREQLRLGASQIKLAIGGSVSGPYDPIDTTQFIPAEIEAAVSAAEGWGTYVTVHGYTVEAVNQAIDAGIKSVEHGQLLDRATLERMATEGIWLSIQPFTLCSEPNLTPQQNAKQAIVCQGTGDVYTAIKELPDLKVVHGTDIFISPGPGIGVSEQVEQMERLLDWFTPYEILKMSTGNFTELLQLSGPRNPYPGDLGVIREGAYADLLIVNGNPLKDLAAVTDRDNIRVIMKDGVIYKNTLE